MLCEIQNSKDLFGVLETLRILLRFFEIIGIYGDSWNSLGLLGYLVMGFHSNLVIISDYCDFSGFLGFSGLFGIL